MLWKKNDIKSLLLKGDICPLLAPRGLCWVTLASGNPGLCPSGALFPSPLDSAPTPPAWPEALLGTLYGMCIITLSTVLAPSIWGGGGDDGSRQLHCWCGILEENWGNYRDYPAVVKTPHSLPTGTIILQTATIKNDLSSLANFTMLLDSLESYPALKEYSGQSEGPLSKWHGWNLMTIV